MRLNLTTRVAVRLGHLREPSARSLLAGTRQSYEAKLDCSSKAGTTGGVIRMTDLIRLVVVDRGHAEGHRRELGRETWVGTAKRAEIGSLDASTMEKEAANLQLLTV